MRGVFAVIPRQSDHDSKLAAVYGGGADRRGVDAFRVDRVFHDDAPPAKVETMLARVFIARMTVSHFDRRALAPSLKLRPQPPASKSSTPSPDAESAPHIPHAPPPTALPKHQPSG